jgi:hypothetical protein
MSFVPKFRIVNRCEYCINHHEQVLLTYWKDREKTRQLITDRFEPGLSEADCLVLGI